MSEEKADIVKAEPTAAAPTTAPVADKGNAPAATPTAPAKAGEQFTMPKGLAAELHKLREDRRKEREEKEALKRELDQVRSHQATAPKADVPSLIDDPEKRLEIERERIKADVVAHMRGETERAERERYIQEQGAAAIDMILTQPEINGDTAKYHEVDAIIASNRELSETARVAPKLAAEKALDMWRRSKGMDGKRQAAEATAAIAGAKPSPATSVSRTAADIKADLKRLNPLAPDFNVKFNALLGELTSAK